MTDHTEAARAKYHDIVREVEAEWGYGGLGPDTMYGEFASEVARRAVDRATQASAPANLLEEAMRLLEVFGKASMRVAVRMTAADIAQLTAAESAFKAFLTANLRATAVVSQPPAGK